MVRRLAVRARSTRVVAWLLFFALAMGATPRVQAYQQYSVQVGTNVIPL